MLRLVRDEPAEGQADSQGVCTTRISGAPAGDLGNPPEPVPHGIRVDEQGSRGGLEGRHLLEVGRCGREECRIGAQLLVHLLDELADGSEIAGQRPLG